MRREQRSSGRTGTPPATAWCRCASPCPSPHDKRAEGAALQLAAKMGLDPAMVVHARQMGTGFTFFVVYGRVTHLVDLGQVTVVERDYPLLAAKEVNAAVRAAAAAQARRGRRVHRHRRAHRRHRRDPQRQGRRGGEGPGVLPGAAGGQPRRPGDGAGTGRRRPRPRRPTRCWSARSSRRGTRTCTTPGRCRPRSGRRTRPAGGRCWSSAGRASTRRWPPTSASTGSSAGAPRRARWPATSSTPCNQKRAA